jgi:F-type H+-transporting ATPase subunit b
MPQFESQFLTPTMIWTIISFVILLVLLKKYALPGVLAVLEERSERIREDLESADKLRQDADALKAELEANLQRAKGAADELIAKAQEKVAAMLADNEAKMRKEGERIVADAHRAIEQERGQAVTDLRAMAADLAVAAAEKFVVNNLDDASRQRLVEESLAELEKQYRA